MGIRQQQKERTRQAFVQAALDMVAEGRSFSSISLRELAHRVGVVPTAYYRHFPDTDTLGLDIVAQVLPTLRDNLRALRRTITGMDSLVEQSVDLFFDYVVHHDKEFLFCGREITGGSRALRRALRREIQTFSRELADDISHLPSCAGLSDNELMAVGDLLSRTMLTIAQDLVEISGHDQAVSVLRQRTLQQMQMVLAGATEFSRMAAVS